MYEFFTIRTSMSMINCSYCILYCFYIFYFCAILNKVLLFLNTLMPLTFIYTYTSHLPPTQKNPWGLPFVHIFLLIFWDVVRGEHYLFVYLTVYVDWSGGPTTFYGDTRMVFSRKPTRKPKIKQGMTFFSHRNKTKNPWPHKWSLGSVNNTDKLTIFYTNIGTYWV